MKLIVYSAISLLFIISFSCANNGSEEFIEGSGNIETNDVLVSSLAAGKIERVFFDEGDRVAKDDTLMIIDHELYGIQLIEAEAARDAAKAQLTLLQKGARKEDIELARENYNQAKASLSLAKKDFERMESLYKSGSVTKREFDEVSTRYDVASAQYRSAEQNLKKTENISREEEIDQAAASLQRAEARVLLIKKNIKDSFITAPIDGIVINRYFEPGEVVSPMSALFKVADLSKVELVIYVNGPELGRVKLGQTAEVYTDTFEGKAYEGSVVYISPEAEFTPKSIQTKEERTKLVYAVKIRIPNPDQELKGGMPADAKIITAN